MSSFLVKGHSGAAGRAVVPPLDNGDHMTRVEFERRWALMPQLKKAELIQGIVFMPAAVREDFHGEPHGLLMGWLTIYRLKTPGIRFADNTSVRLDDENMPQPDGYLRLPAPLSTGQCVEGYVEGAPDLVLEISASSVSIDLHRKLDVYRNSGVREYVVWRTLDEEVDWFVLTNGDYKPLPLDAEGWLKSRLFPGLWLQPEVLMYGLPDAVYEMFHAGLASPEHAAFVEKLRQLS